MAMNDQNQLAVEMESARIGGSVSPCYEPPPPPGYPTKDDDVKGCSVPTETMPRGIGLGPLTAIKNCLCECVTCIPDCCGS